MKSAMRVVGRALRSRTAAKILIVFFTLATAWPAFSAAARPATGELSSSLQSDEIVRLEAQASELEGRAARLRQAVENCRRSISPQAPDCYIEISWLRSRVPYQEAARIAADMEEQARQIRGRIEYLRSQQNRPAPPPPPPVTTPPAVTVTPPVSNAPTTQQTTTNQQTTQTVQAPPVSRPQPPPPEPRVGGLSWREWNQLLSSQRRLEELYRDYASNREEADKLRDRVLELWQKAMSGPLTPEQRKMLRINLPTRTPPSGPVKTNHNQIAELEEKNLRSVSSPPPSPLSLAGNLVQSHIETGTQQAFDEFGKSWAEAVNLDGVDRKWLNYENVVGLSKVSLKLKDKDYAGAISEAVDFIVGKVTLPLTSMNVSVFKSVYSQTTFGALNKFMEDSMKMTGAEFSYEEMTKDMNVGQKAVMEWVGFGELMREKDKERGKE